MKVCDLIERLETQYDVNDEIALQVDFHAHPNWSVLSYDVVLEDGKLDETGNPTFRVTVYGADFDYPGILKEVKEAVAKLP